MSGNTEVDNDLETCEIRNQAWLKGVNSEGEEEEEQKETEMEKRK